MQCPNCKEELKDGNLYCEKCGYEIQMVPDFEPEVDGSILTSLREIQKEAFDERKNTEALDKDIKEQSKLSYRIQNFKKEHKMVFNVLTTFCVSFCVLFILGMFFLVRYLSPTVQYNKAVEAFESQNYSECLSYVNHTIMLQPEFMDAYFVGYKCAMEMEDYNSAEKYLTDGLYYSAFDDNEIIYCFDELIKIYESKQQYKIINQLLILCPSSIIVSKYQEYLALPVEFSYAEGTYPDTIPLKMTAISEGTIYYTTDGSEPDTGSIKYTGPIFLNGGEHTIKALFINEYGVESDMVTRKYIIETRVIPYPPSVSCYSGEYEIPEMITIDSEDGCSVYYTTDGTIPTEESIKYTEAIPMPLGKTTFKFVRYNDDTGFASEIITREYSFVLNTDYGFMEAQRDLYALMINENIILDYAGTRSNYVGTNSYDYQYVFTKEEMGEFYLFSESFNPDDGNGYQTGNYFAVNVYDRTIYRVSITENMDYVLTSY